MNLDLVAGGLLGGIVGLALGLLGGGGSVLAVPLLALGVGLDDKSALTGSLLVVAASAFAGGIPRIAEGDVDYRAAAIFGGAGALSSYLFSLASRPLPADVQIALLAATMLVSGTLMLQKARRTAGPSMTRVGTPSPSAAGVGPMTRLGMKAPGEPEGVGASTRLGMKIIDLDEPPPSLARTILAAIGAGALTGVTSIGGGFIIVPAMIVGARIHVDKAVGASLLVITVNATASWLGKADKSITFDPRVVAFGIGAVVVSLGAARLASRIGSATKGRIMGGILTIVGTGMLARAVWQSFR